MAGLKETLAALRRRRNGDGVEDTRGGRMLDLPAPPANPGALKMHVYAPASMKAGAPLVVVLHGCTQSAEGYSSGAGWLTLADRFGFAVLAPGQTFANNANRCFNWFLPVDIARTGGEAASIAQMVESTLKSYRLDRSRVFVTGLSAGGAMAVVMLATYPEIFSGAGIIAGLPYGVAQSMPEAFSAMAQGSRESSVSLGEKVRRLGKNTIRWPRVSIWHGAADRTVHPGAAEALARQWCDLHGVAGGGAEKRSPTGRSYQSWLSHVGESVVELHRIPGMAHGTPIGTTGPEGCGSSGPFLLDVGVSSSFELARSWGIALNAETAQNAQRGVLEPEIIDTDSLPLPDPPAQPQAKSESPILETINDALRKAGLMR